MNKLYKTDCTNEKYLEFRNTIGENEMIEDKGEYYEIVPIPQPTEEEMANELIVELKQKLSATDYQAIKFAEGILSEEEYEPIRTQRAEWRQKINDLEEQAISNK